MIGKALIKDSAIYGGADFISKLLAFIAFPVVAAALDPIAFGALELIFTSIALTGVIVNCGLNNSLQRYYWDKDVPIAAQPTLVTTGLFTQMAFCLIVMITGFGLLSVFNPRLETEDLPFSATALISAIFLLICTQCTQFILDVTRLHFAPWRFLFLALLVRVFTLAAGVAAVVFAGLGIDGMLFGQVLVYIFVIPIAFFMIRRDIVFREFNLMWAKKLIKFGSPFIFAGMAYWLFSSMDRWMLSSMRSLEEVGVYSVAARFASIVLFLSLAFGQAFSPLAMKIRRDYPGEYRIIYGKILIGLLAVMLLAASGVSFFAGEILFLLMPADYMSASVPIILLSFGIVIQSAQQVTAVGISIEKKTHLFAKLAWAAALINYVGNWVLIPRYGISGAAGSTILSYSFISLSYFFFTQRLHPIIVPKYMLGLIGTLFCLLLLVSTGLVQSTFSVQVVILKLVFLIVLSTIIVAYFYRYFMKLNPLDHLRT